MWKINWMSVVLICGITAGIFALIYFLVPGVNMLLIVLFIYTMILILAIIGGYSLYNYTQTKKHEYLNEKGISGTATLLSVQGTGEYFNNLPRYKMKFRITIPGKEPYDVKQKKTMGFLSIGNLMVGMQYPVLVDPNKPKRMIIKGIDY